MEIPTASDTAIERPSKGCIVLFHLLFMGVGVAKYGQMGRLDQQAKTREHEFQTTQGLILTVFFNEVIFITTACFVFAVKNWITIWHSIKDC